MPVEFIDRDDVLMGEGTYMWVKQQHFKFHATDDDQAVLAQIIASDAYAWDYASSPAPPDPRHVTGEIHGRWSLDAITVDRFVPVRAEEAISVIHKWATEQEWTDSDYRQPEEAMSRLKPVYELLSSGSVFQLEIPAEETVIGFWLGSMGFHEFVVLDRSSGSLHLIVASDD